MIRYLTHKEIDITKWDKCINYASNGIVYAMSWYLDIASPGWDALVEDDYISVFPLTRNKKYGITYLHQPLFTQQLGVFSKDDISEALIREYLAIISNQYKFIEINLNTENHFSSSDVKINELLTHHLDLNAAYESIRKNYSQNTLRNISTALKSKVSLDLDADENKIIRLFRQNRGKDISSLKTKDYQILLNIVKEGKKKGLVQVIGAKTSAGDLCAGAIFICKHNKIIFLFSGASAEAKKKGAMSMIIDSVIKSNAQTNTTLDFEGSMDKKLARFYKSFGSKEIVYLHIKRNNLPTFVRWIKN